MTLLKAESAMRAYQVTLGSLSGPFAFRMSVASIDEFGFHIKTDEFALSEKEILTAFEISMNMVHRSQLKQKTPQY